jgi:hypothetical protein
METFNVTKVSILVFDRSTGIKLPFTGIFLTYLYYSIKNV